MTYLVGFDPSGKGADHDAISVTDTAATPMLCGHLERLPQGLTFKTKLERVVTVAAALKPRGRVVVIVDGTGIGAPLVESLRDACTTIGVQVVSVTITAGASTSHDGDDWRVPKSSLIGAGQVALEHDRIQIVRGAAFSVELTAELRGYEMKVTAHGNETYGANGRGDSVHDDLVLAFCLPLWFAGKVTLAGIVGPARRAGAPAVSWFGATKTSP